MEALYIKMWNILVLNYYIILPQKLTTFEVGLTSNTNATAKDKWSLE